jgi:hypothetical protein
MITYIPTIVLNDRSVGGIPTPMDKYEFVKWDDEIPNTTIPGPSPRGRPRKAQPWHSSLWFCVKKICGKSMSISKP